MGWGWVREEWCVWNAPIREGTTAVVYHETGRLTKSVVQQGHKARCRTYLVEQALQPRSIYTKFAPHVSLPRTYASSTSRSEGGGGWAWNGGRRERRDDGAVCHGDTHAGKMQ